MADRINRAVRWMQSWSAFWLFGAWLAFFVTTHVWPTTWWMNVRSVGVFNTEPGEPIFLQVDRTINRPFVAEWAVVVRRQIGDDQWVVACTAEGTSDYIPTAVLPNPLTLSWWTDGDCEDLPEGTYNISTLWTITGNPGLPDKVIRVVSNDFEVARLGT